MKTEDAPGIIEIIDDDVDPFSNRSAGHTLEDSGGRRWVGPVALAALVALIGYGIATSASAGVPNVASAPSTTNRPPTTTVPAPKTTIPPKLVPYYSADPPREFTVAYADASEPDPGYYGDGTYELWATDNSNAGSGAWFAIEAQRGGRPVYAVDAYRVLNGDQSVGISHLPSGQSRAEFMAKNGTATMTITSFGISDERIAKLAESITVESGVVQLNDVSVFPAFRRITGVYPWRALQGVPAAEVFYQSNIDRDHGINLVVSPRLPPDQGGGTLDRQIAIRFFLDHAIPFTVDGHVAAAGALVGEPDYAMATWIAGDHTVTISASMTVPELITIARTVHEVSDSEWAGMQYQATRHNSDNNFGDFDQSPNVPVSFGSDGQAKNWVVQVALLTFAKEQQILWQWGAGFAQDQFGSLAGETAKINTVVSDDHTYVLADLPRSVAPTARLLIARDGLDPVVVPFTDADPDFDRTFAAYAFSEATPYTAQIIGEDGTLLANWPTA